jgi:hypothetical protein
LSFSLFSLFSLFYNLIEIPEHFYLNFYNL